MRKKFKNKLILALKGGIIGIANIVPGVSGGTLAITLGIYETLISSVNNFFKDMIGSIKTLMPIGIGAVIAILSVSEIISYSLEKVPFIVTLFFIGLVLGGVPFLYAKTKNKLKKASGITVAISSFLIILSFLFFSEASNNVVLENLMFKDYFALFLIGIIAAITIVVPGVSGSFILMLLGYYKPLLDLVGEFIRFKNIFENTLILIPFGLGLVIGVLLVSRIIEFFLKKHNELTYSSIIGIVMASIILIVIPLLSLNITIYDIIFGALLLTFGFFISFKIGE